MYEKNVLLHFLNLEYRRIIGFETFISKEKAQNQLHKMNYIAILLCKEHCILPYSALIEDDMVSEIFLKKRYDIFFETGLIKASLRENSPEEFLEKKTVEYDSSPELYGYYKKDALEKLKKHDIHILKREFKTGKSIQEIWNNDLEENANKSVWRDVLTEKEDFKISKKLKEIPNKILDQGKGIIWPLVNKLLDMDDEIKKSKIRHVLNRIYFSNLTNKEQSVILTNLPMQEIGINSETSQNYNYRIFTKLLSQIGLLDRIWLLSPQALTSLKMSNEFDGFISKYHNTFGKFNNETEARKSLIEMNKKENHKLTKIKKPKMNNLEYIFDALYRANSIIEESKTFEFQLGAIQSDKKFDIGILTALYEDEFDQIQNYIGNEWNQNEITDKTKMYLTTRVVTKERRKIKIIGSSQIDTGVVEAGIFATEIINNYNPKYLIMPGVLAGKPEKANDEQMEINLGDIVVGTKLFMFEKGKHSNQGFEVELEDEKIDSKLLQQIRLNKKSILNKVKLKLEEISINNDKILKNINIEKLDVHIAPIACSLSVVDKDGYFDKNVMTIERKTKGLEMESFGVARACRLSNNSKTKALVIKSVMDKTSGKNDDMKQIAGLTSALFVKYLIEDVLNFD